MNNIEQYQSSFRDKSGFIFKENDIFFRQVNQSYQQEYDLLMSSGLCKTLQNKNYLIQHSEVKDGIGDCYKVLKPNQLTFISYPASWSFSMLKDAALLTLSIQKQAILHRMILKDASAYNVQFVGSKPIFIDTLSFKKLAENETWLAYGQFCRHFLAPLALMSFTGVSLNKLFAIYLDGLPLDLTAKLLPLKARFNLGLYIHLFLHSQIIQKNQTKGDRVVENFFSVQDLLNQVENLIDTIKNLTIKKQVSEWNEYYLNDVQDDYLSNKKQVVSDFLQTINPKKVLDLGANDGTFSLIASDFCEEVLSFDLDPLCVEQNYLYLKKNKITTILPLIVDVTNPESAIGWDNKERERLFDRAKPDTIMVLALVHHLRITAGIPLTKIAAFLSEHCQYLIIEFIPKSDEKVRMLLQNRENVFDDYSLESFIDAFCKYFDSIQQIVVEPTKRICFLLKNNNIK